MMLASAGLNFTIVAPYVDEQEILRDNHDWTPEEAALRLAEAKAIEVSTRNPGNIVIGADQTLAFNQRVFSKSATLETARSVLLDLRGQTHRLISSVVCARDGLAVWNATTLANLTMRNFSPEFLDDYLQKCGPTILSSVGAYQIEGRGSQLFDRLEGDHFTIMGLPLLPLMKFLRENGELPT